MEPRRPGSRSFAGVADQSDMNVGQVLDALHVGEYRTLILGRVSPPSADVISLANVSVITSPALMLKWASTSSMVFTTFFGSRRA